MINPLALVLLAAAASLAAAEPPGAIAIEEAIALALRSQPLADAYRHAAEARASAARREAAWPDPVLNVTAERLARIRGPRGGDDTETSVLVSQRLRIGGDAARRAAAAAAQGGAAVRDERLLDIARETADAFVEVLAAERRRDLALQAALLVERQRATLEQRAGAGDAAAAAAAAARADTAVALAAAARAGVQVGVARAVLARMCGDERFAILALRSPSPRSSAPAADAVERHPSVTQWLQAARQAQAEIAATARDRWQPEVGVGAIHDEADGSTGLVLALELPLPISGGHRHAGEAARARLREAEAMANAERLRLIDLLDRTVRQRASAEAAVQQLMQEALPAAHEAYMAAVMARDAGALGEDAVIAAEERSLAVRREALAVQVDGWRAWIAQWHAEGLVPDITPKAGADIGRGQSSRSGQP